MDSFAIGKLKYERARMRARQRMINATVEYIKLTGYTTVTIPINIEKLKLCLIIADRTEVRANLMSS